MRVAYEAFEALLVISHVHDGHETFERIDELATLLARVAYDCKLVAVADDVVAHR